MTNDPKPNTPARLISDLRTDCLHFRGDRPCAPHIASGATCACEKIIPAKKSGIIIKLGAAGDVLRTTPLLRALDPLNTGTRIVWVTQYPEMLPPDLCEAVQSNSATLARLYASEWDFCWNLDKDIEACSIAVHVRAREHAGFTLKNGMPHPVDERAWHKFCTGLDNPYSKSNRLTYVQEMFDITGMPYHGEEYCLRSPSAASCRTAENLLPGEGWIGLNTGTGRRWPTRIWPESHWIRLIALLKEQSIKTVIMGGPEEETLNARIAEATGCLWPGVHSLDEYYAMIHRCKCLVTSVTQAMHLAIAAKTPLVLFNNIFNSCEFELYGRGEILSPQTPCDCYYAARCRSGRNCISEITPENTMTAILRTLQA